MKQARYSILDATSYVEGILTQLEAAPADARRVAEALVLSDRVGHASHGVRQLPYYANQIRMGEIDVAASLTVVADHGALLVTDGNHGFGHVSAMDAATIASERARRDGVAVVGLRQANHIGRLGEYTEMIARSGQAAILFATCEGTGQQIAPFGGIDRRLTNNPLSLAVPGDEFPIVLDMALSAVAESRVYHAIEQGSDIPEGWVFDANGASTTNPNDYDNGGSLVPVGGPDGGHKGYALTVLTELIVGMLAQTRVCGPEVRPFSNAFALIVIDDGAGARHAELASFMEWIGSSRRRPGVERILLPGQKEQQNSELNSTTIPLDNSTVDLLQELAAEVGMTTTLEAA